MNITLNNFNSLPFMKTGTILEESTFKHSNFDLEGLKLMLYLEGLKVMLQINIIKYRPLIAFFWYFKPLFM